MLGLSRGLKTTLSSPTRSRIPLDENACSPAAAKLDNINNATAARLRAPVVDPLSITSIPPQFSTGRHQDAGLCTNTVPHRLAQRSWELNSFWGEDQCKVQQQLQVLSR